MLPGSNVNCFSGILNMAALKIVESDLPFELNAYTDKVYNPPGDSVDTVKRGIVDVILALIS